MAKRFRKKNQYPTVLDGQSGFERAVPEVWIHKMAYKKNSKLGSDAGPVIQTNGRLTFEDDLISGGLLYFITQ